MKSFTLNTSDTEKVRMEQIAMQAQEIIDQNKITSVKEWATFIGYKCQNIPSNQWSAYIDKCNAAIYGQNKDTHAEDHSHSTITKSGAHLTVEVNPSAGVMGDISETNLD